MADGLIGRIEWKRLISKLSPYTVLKGIRYFRHYGPKEFWIRLHERFEPEEVPYGPWYEAYRPDQKTLDGQRGVHFSCSPKISIAVPAYRTPLPYLREMIDSVRAQTYENWELCLANASPEDEKMSALLQELEREEPRLKVKALSENAGISENTNEALSMAEGDWIALMDHDDLLAPNALFEAVKAMNRHPDAEMIYTDEDKVRGEGEHFQPHLKPDFSLDLLRSNNYICHLLLLRKSLLARTGPVRPAFDGAQDYDLILRCAENAKEIVHLPEILYHWRTHQASTADNPASKSYAYEAGARAIAEHLKRTNTPGEVLMTKDYGFYRVKYPVQGRPLVSIIIPNKDEAKTLSDCIASIREKTGYDAYEIIVVENNSESGEIEELYARLEKEGVKLVRYAGEFNYAAINNFGVRSARGEYLLFLNNDITVISPDWMEEMLGVCQRPDVGAVGAKLLYPDGTIQHAGCVVGMGGIAGAMFSGMDASRTGYLHKASLLQDVSAVTAACMMMKKSVFLQLGGFCEELKVAFNDIDLCLRVRQLGLWVVYDPYAMLTHYESKTRGAEDDRKKVHRFQNEIEYMRVHWIGILKEGDPFYNKNLSLTKWNYSLRPLEGMEGIRQIPGGQRGGGEEIPGSEE